MSITFDSWFVKRSFKQTLIWLMLKVKHGFQQLNETNFPTNAFLKAVQYILGIDAGGTSVRIQLTCHEGGSFNATLPAYPDGLPPAELRAIFSEYSVATACAGITKYTRAGVRDSWGKFLRKCFPVAVISIVPDYEIAFHSLLTDGNGIMVIAGTGSVAYGENLSTNQQLRVGGRGWEWGDEGSGAWLTTEMVRRTLRALDGMSIMTPLSKSVSALLGTNEPAALAALARERAMQEGEGRGFLLPLLAEQSEAGDREARDLFIGAGGWLSALAAATATQIGFAKYQEVPIGIAGGVWKAGGETLRNAFTNALSRRFERVLLIELDAVPVEGATRLASKLIPPGNGYY